MFLLRRDLGNLVPYVQALMLAVPGNNTMSLFSERSRDIRRHHLWKQAKERGDTEVRREKMRAGMGFR